MAEKEARPATEKERCLDWYRHEREEKGLVDVKFLPTDANGDFGEEEYYKELNEIIRLREAGKAMLHPELI